MGTVARQVCANAGSNVIARGDGADKILNISREYFAPGAADSEYLEVARLSLFKRTDQKQGIPVVESDLLRRKAEFRMLMGGASAKAFVSVLRMQNAAFPRPGELLVLAARRSPSGRPGCSRYRRVLGERGRFRRAGGVT